MVKAFIVGSLWHATIGFRIFLRGRRRKNFKLDKKHFTLQKDLAQIDFQAFEKWLFSGLFHEAAKLRVADAILLFRLELEVQPSSKKKK